MKPHVFSSDTHIQSGKTLTIQALRQKFSRGTKLAIAKTGHSAVAQKQSSKDLKEDEMVKNMIKGATMFLLLVTLSLVTAVVSAQAQGSRSEYADIPFDFKAGDKELPAGRYQVSQSTSGEAVTVRGVENSISVVKMTNHLVQLDPAKTSKLVFNRYGNQYFLSEVWIAGRSTGQQIRKTNAEKAIQRELTASRRMRERLDIALAR